MKIFGVKEFSPINFKVKIVKLKFVVTKNHAADPEIGCHNFDFKAVLPRNGQADSVEGLITWFEFSHLSWRHDW